jgi:hypothetical protein
MISTVKGALLKTSYMIWSTVEHQHCRLLTSISRKSKTSIGKSRKETTFNKAFYESLGRLNRWMGRNIWSGTQYSRTHCTLSKTLTARDKKRNVASAIYQISKNNCKTFHTGSVILFRVSSKQYGTIGCLYLIVDKGIRYGPVCCDFEELRLQASIKKITSVCCSWTMYRRMSEKRLKHIIFL